MGKMRRIRQVWAEEDRKGEGERNEERGRGKDIGLVRDMIG